MPEYKLSFTAADINSKLGKIDKLSTDVESLKSDFYNSDLSGLNSTVNNLNTAMQSTVKTQSQTLTNEEKLQARTNIDAASNSDVNTRFSTVENNIDSLERSVGSLETTHANDKAVLQNSVDGKVPLTRTVNGKPLSSDILLNASDVNAATTIHASSHSANGADPIMPHMIGAKSNENLLDNWYFSDPINQRGQTEYSSGYGPDRWHITTNGTGTAQIIPGEGVKITAISGSYFDFRQILENIDADETVTISAMINGNLHTATGKFGMSLSISADGYSGMIYYIENAVILRPNTGNAWMVKAVKLEHGSQQTLAHQDGNGNWVLNDPPPNKAQELAKCQRYQLAIGESINIRAVSLSSGSIYFSMPVPDAMRGNPTIIPKSADDLYVSAYNAQSTQTGFTFKAFTRPGCVVIGATKTGHGLSDARLFVRNTIFDANL